MSSIMLYLTYCVAICVSLCSVFWLMIKAEQSKTTYMFILCQILIVVWCITQFFIGMPQNKIQQSILYDVCYLGICFIGPSWLIFSMYYSERNVSRIHVLLWYFIPVIHYAVLFTNEFHHLFYTKFEIHVTEYGPLFYTNMLYTYFCILIGMFITYRGWGKGSVEHSQRKAVLWSAVIPIIANVLYITGCIRPGFDITPLAFSLSSIILLLATYQYHFLNVNIIAFDKIFENIAEGILIYNETGKITYTNHTAETLFHTKKGDSIDSISKIMEENENQVEKDNIDDETEFSVLMIERKRFELRKYRHSNKKGRAIATTLMFTDVSKYYELLERTRELAISNQQLAVERERNRIAQNVHDTVGHTLTMVSSLMKLTKIDYEQENYGHLQEYLEQAQKLTADGIKELRLSIHNLKQSESCELVTQGIYQLANSIKEFEIEVSIQGRDGAQYSSLSKVIYDSFREILTNCLKYADATHVDVILKFHEESLDFYIFDNGVGCDKIILGTGLDGIKNRVKEVGGTVKFSSVKGEGFQAAIRLPIDKKER